MLNTPLVSVIIPSYNHESYVKYAIDSILKQDYLNIELLILDDGSKDNSYKLLTALKPICEKRCKRVVLKKQTNQGTSCTLSNLVDQCQGKYILACASDDMLCPSCISEQVQIMEQDDSVVQTLPDNYFIDVAGNRLERAYNQTDTYYPLGTNKKNYPTFATFWNSQMSDNIFSSDQFHSYENLLKKHVYLNGSLWRAKAIKQFFPLPNCPLSEDYYINLQLAKLGKVQFVNKPLFMYRIHSSQTIKKHVLVQRLEKNLFIAELEQVSKPGQGHWKSLLKRVWFTPVCTRKGCLGCYIEHYISFVCSQRILNLFGLKITLHTRYKYNIPNWWKEKENITK